MTIESNKAIVLDLLTHWLDAERLDELTDPTAAFVVEADPSLFPNAGTHTKDDILERWRWAHDHFPGGMTMVVKGVTAEGRRVAVEAEAKGVLRLDSGVERSFGNRYHFVFELDDGRLTRVVEYQDTAFALSLVNAGFTSDAVLGTEP